MYCIANYYISLSNTTIMYSLYTCSADVVDVMEEHTAESLLTTCSISDPGRCKVIDTLAIHHRKFIH